MKNYILTLVIGIITFTTFAQGDPVFRSVRATVANATEMNAIPSTKLDDGQLVYRLDTETIWVYDNALWNNTGVGAAGITGGTGEILTFGTGLTKAGTNVTLDNPFTATDENAIAANTSGLALKQDLLTGSETVFDGRYLQSETDPTVNQPLIEGLGFVTGSHTVDTDTQLSDAEVATAVNNEFPNLDVDDTDDFDGSWNSLTDIPADIADGDDIGVGTGGGAIAYTDSGVVPVTATAGQTLVTHDTFAIDQNTLEAGDKIVFTHLGYYTGLDGSFLTRVNITSGGAIVVSLDTGGASNGHFKAVTEIMMVTNTTAIANMVVTSRNDPSVGGSLNSHYDENSTFSMPDNTAATTAITMHFGNNGTVGTVTLDASDVKVIKANFTGGSSSGEANTASNLGAGEGIFTTKSGTDLPFKSLVAGANVTLTSDANTITIDATTGSGGIQSNTTGEPTGATAITKMVKISEPDYEAAVLAATTVAGTDYIIEGASPADLFDSVSNIPLDAHYYAQNNSAINLTIFTTSSSLRKRGGSWSGWINTATEPTIDGVSVSTNGATWAANTDYDLVIYYDGNAVRNFLIPR